MKKESGTIIYSPSDLIRYLASPFGSWLDRYRLEGLGEIKPDEQTEEEKLLSRTGDEHESAESRFGPIGRYLKWTWHTRESLGSKLRKKLKELLTKVFVTNTRGSKSFMEADEQPGVL